MNPTYPESLVRRVLASIDAEPFTGRVRGYVSRLAQSERLERRFRRLQSLDDAQRDTGLSWRKFAHDSGSQFATLASDEAAARSLAL